MVLGHPLVVQRGMSFLIKIKRVFDDKYSCLYSFFLCVWGFQNKRQVLVLLNRILMFLEKKNLTTISAKLDINEHNRIKLNEACAHSFVGLQ